MIYPVIDAPSPNHNEREGTPVTMLVMHYTGMQTGEEALARMRDPEAKVAAHYMVETDGRIFKLVPEDRRAWHAGIGFWRGVEDINSASIGIEIVNPGHLWGYEEFPEAQIDAVLALTKEILERHPIKPLGVIGHSDLAPDRKDDPGEKFPWARFAEAGLALPPYQGPVSPDAPDFEPALEMLYQIGYAVTLRSHIAPVLAFQRRFCPQDLGGGLSPLTRTAIAATHALIGR